MNFMGWIDKIMENDAVKIISFILLVFGAVGIPLSVRDVMKWTVMLYKSKETRNIMLATILVVLYIVIGLIIPLFIIIGLWSNPFTWTWLLMQILAWWLLLSFVGLIYLIIKTELMLKEIEKEGGKKKS